MKGQYSLLNKGSIDFFFGIVGIDTGFLHIGKHLFAVDFYLEGKRQVSMQTQG